MPKAKKVASTERIASLTCGQCKRTFTRPARAVRGKAEPFFCCVKCRSLFFEGSKPASGTCVKCGEKFRTLLPPGAKIRPTCGPHGCLVDIAKKNAERNNPHAASDAFLAALRATGKDFEDTRTNDNAPLRLLPPPTLERGHWEGG